MAGILAMYIRISMEDEDLRSNGEKTESNSISNQRELLQRFIDEREAFGGFEIKEYFDDGYTGRNFERPGFRKMIEECRMGMVNCIAVKDLSRLGRNYVEVGNLLEQLFPFLGVRVISVNDGYDSDSFIGQTGGIDVAFKNLIYNLYSRDLSNKVKSAVETRMKRGEFMSPYGFFGYEKSQEDIHKLVIDQEAAAIVRQLFLMVADGIPRKDIVKTLNEQGVPTPAVYKQKRGCTRDWYPAGKKGGWNTSMVAKIIRDERYAGHMVSRKKVYEAFDSRHQVDVDRSEWIVVRNTHEGIVTQEEFDQANANMRTVVQGKKEKPANKKNFSVIVCPHCGLRLRPGNRTDSFMHCPTGRNHKDSVCNGVRVRRNVAEDTLVQLVRQQAQMLVQAEELLKKQKNPYAENPPVNMNVITIELKKLEDVKIADYECYKSGKISRETFIERKRLSDVRKSELQSILSELQAQELVCDMNQKEYGEALEIKKYLNLESFDKTVMTSLIVSAKVMGEDSLEVEWKHHDIYEKIFADLAR